ncbi:MAG: hypothetical protein ACM30G_16875 [Micromonosporaceae bacterium]
MDALSLRGSRVQNAKASSANVQNLRRGHYHLASHVSPNQRVAAAFTELATAI